MHGIAMLLKQYMARRAFSEIRPFFILAFCDQSTENLAPSFVFDYFNIIEPVFYVITFDDDAGTIPLTWAIYPFSIAIRFG